MKFIWDGGSDWKNDNSCTIRWTPQHKIKLIVDQNRWTVWLVVGKGKVQNIVLCKGVSATYQQAIENCEDAFIALGKVFLPHKDAPKEATDGE